MYGNGRQTRGEGSCFFMCRNKAGGELRVDAVEFVPGQWDKPKQGAVPAEAAAADTQLSISGMTDDDSVAPGSDANGMGWTAAEYSQQYYIAQVCRAIAHISVQAELPHTPFLPFWLLFKVPSTHVPPDLRSLFSHNSHLP